MEKRSGYRKSQCIILLRITLNYRALRLPYVIPFNPHVIHETVYILLQIIKQRVGIVEYLAQQVRSRVGTEVMFIRLKSVPLTTTAFPTEHKPKGTHQNVFRVRGGVNTSSLGALHCPHLAWG